MFYKYSFCPPTFPSFFFVFQEFGVCFLCLHLCVGNSRKLKRFFFNKRSLRFRVLVVNLRLHSSLHNKPMAPSTSKYKLFFNVKVPTSIDAIVSSSQSLPSFLSSSSSPNAINVDYLDLNLPFLALELKTLLEPQKKHKKKEWELNQIFQKSVGYKSSLG